MEMRVRDIKTVSQAVLVPELSASIEQPQILNTNQITKHEQLKSVKLPTLTGGLPSSLVSMMVFRWPTVVEAGTSSSSSDSLTRGLNTLTLTRPGSPSITELFLRAKHLSNTATATATATATGVIQQLLLLVRKYFLTHWIKNTRGLIKTALYSVNIISLLDSFTE